MTRAINLHRMPHPPMPSDLNIVSNKQRDLVQANTIQISLPVHKKDIQCRVCVTKVIKLTRPAQELTRLRILRAEALHIQCDSVNSHLRLLTRQDQVTMIQAIIRQRKVRHPTDSEVNVKSRVAMDQVQGLIILNSHPAHKKDTP